MIKAFEYLTGQGGLLILGLVVLVVLIVRKWKEKRYFNYIEKKIDEKKKSS